MCHKKPQAAMIVYQQIYCICYTLMIDASPKQRIPCIIHITSFGTFSVGKQ